MKVLVLVLMLALVASCSATMTYTLDEKIETAPSSQLWYEGLWKEVRGLGIGFQDLARAAPCLANPLLFSVAYCSAFLGPLAQWNRLLG